MIHRQKKIITLEDDQFIGTCVKTTMEKKKESVIKSSMMEKKNPYLFKNHHSIVETMKVNWKY